MARNRSNSIRKTEAVKPVADHHFKYICGPNSSDSSKDKCITTQIGKGGSKKGEREKAIYLLNGIIICSSAGQVSIILE